ncbi:MAG: hypothetical protein JXA37_03715 [Chloroflexia bacterium]|nr:hypothetical protein [Chloroflexia bacterium]
MSTHNKTVLLYGGSPLLVDIEARLRNEPGWHALRIDPIYPNVTDQLALMNASLLLYEPDSSNPRVVQDFLSAHHEVVMVSVDLSGQYLLAFHHREYPSSKLQALFLLIRETVVQDNLLSVASYEC